MSRDRTMLSLIQEYLTYRRSLGFDLRQVECLLRQFAKFMDESGWQGTVTVEVLLGWVTLPNAASAAYKSSRLSAVRGFAQYLATRDNQLEVPGHRLFPKSFRSRPHIFGERDLAQLVEAAQELKPTYQLRPLTYQTLFGLLASTGLRISEAFKLPIERVDLDRGILRIEQTKFKKSRLVPLHPSTVQTLGRYLAERTRLWGKDESRPFFVGPLGLALSEWGARDAFRTICTELGWQRGNGDWPRPRIHDLRHSFACQCLLNWYREGENVHHRIAALSTYLGHACVTNTYWYLTATPELLGIAASRFEQFATSVEGRQP